MVLGVFFGSRSCEHDVSIVTALQAIQNIDMKHTVVPVYIDRTGAWWTETACSTSPPTAVR
jgi:D-alanine-D-alanine ligase